MKSKHQVGMTLIELMIGIALFAILLTMGAPTFSRWIQSSQIRNAAEAIHNGLTLARAEAVRRNTAVRFQLVTTTTAACVLSDIGTNWVVNLERGGSPAGLCNAAPSDDDDPLIIQVRSAAEGSPNAFINANGVPLIVFNGTGQANIATTIDVTNPTGGACAPVGPMRCMRVTVATGGRIRMCDPARAANDPQGC